MTFSPLMAYRMWQRNRDVFLANWKASVAIVVGEPLLLLVALGFGMSSLITTRPQGITYSEFIAPGIIAGYVMFRATGECLWGTFFRMVRQKTFDAILATPMGVEELVAGEVLWAASSAVLPSVAILALAMVFGFVTSPLALLIIPASFIAGLLFACIAISFTAIAPSIYAIEVFFSLVIWPMWFFSGAFFPLTSMPELVRVLTWVLPLTPTVHLTRALSTGGLDIMVLPSVGILLGLTAVFLPLAFFLVRRRLVK